MDDKRFKELLEKALDGSIAEEEEKELLRDYILKPQKFSPLFSLPVITNTLRHITIWAICIKKVSDVKNLYTWLGFNGRFLFRKADADSLKSGIATGSAQVA